MWLFTRWPVWVKVLATLWALLVLSMWAGAGRQPVTSPASPPAAAPVQQGQSGSALAVSDQAKAEAVELLGAAVSQRQAGDLGLALELGRQALGKWPDYPEAKAFMAEVAPQATAAARETQAQATTQARAAATEQAQAAAVARQQATAQAVAAAGTAAAANLQIVSVTSPAPRNSSATVVVRTVPGAACDVTVRYASGVSRAAGLEPKTAGPAGTVSWTWQVGGSTTPGEWPISVSCSSGGRRWEQQTSFRVS
jgi:hypothetical protein